MSIGDGVVAQGLETCLKDMKTRGYAEAIEEFCELYAPLKQGIETLFEGNQTLQNYMRDQTCKRMSRFYLHPKNFELLGDALKEVVSECGCARVVGLESRLGVPEAVIQTLEFAEAMGLKRPVDVLPTCVPTVDSGVGPHVMPIDVVDAAKLYSAYYNCFFTVWPDSDASMGEAARAIQRCTQMTSFFIYVGRGRGRHPALFAALRSWELLWEKPTPARWETREDFVFVFRYRVAT